MRPSALLGLLMGLVIALGTEAAGGSRPPEGQLTVGVNFTIAPTYLDPSETTSTITSAIVLYAFHEALFKPVPGDPAAPALAETWTEGPDGLIYELSLRQGLTFHNGDPFTAEDVRYSFQRYKGVAASVLRERVKAVEVLDAHRLRFVLHAPWPDFLTLYSVLASGVGWVVPKQYLERVGEEGFKQQPIGLGPYRFVRADPGVGLVLEAYERFWRTTPAVQRLILKSLPDPSTRLAMLKTGEVDLAVLPPDEAAAAARDPKLRLVPAETGIRACLKTSSRVGNWG